MITYDSSDARAALSRKTLVQPWAKGDGKQQKADQIAHQRSSITTSQE